MLPPEGGARRGWTAFPAVIFVVGYVALLLCIPAQLVVGPLGAAGTPANLWGIAALLWWACALLGGGVPRVPSLSRRVFAALCVTVIASYTAGNATGWYAPADVRQVTDRLYSLLPVTPAEVQLKMLSAADRGLLTFAAWCGIVLITADGLRNGDDFRTLLSWLSWLAAFVAALGVVQYFTGIDIAGLFSIPGLRPNADFGEVDARSVLNRVASTATHPIEFGVVMAGLFPLLLHRTIHRRGELLALVPTLLVGIAIPMSVSRSGILVLALAMLILFIGWPPQWRGRALVMAPVAAVALRLMAPGLVGTIRSLFTNLNNDPSVTGRTADYSVIFHLYREQPWLGRGLFTFVPEYYRILDNQFLVILLELGAVGLAVTLAFFLAVLVEAEWARRNSRSSEHKHLCLSLTASFAGVVVSFATFDAWSFPMAAGTSFLLVGLIMAAARIARHEAATAPPRPLMSRSQVSPLATRTSRATYGSAQDFLQPSSSEGRS